MVLRIKIVIPGLQKAREGGKIFPGRYENQIPQRQVLLKLKLTGRMKEYLLSGR